MKLNYKFWLEEDDEKLFGDGPCDILELVDKLGSLRKASAEINMSYSQAWNLIKDMEEKLDFKLLEKKVGGADGGGSRLTEKGKLLLNTFASFRNEAQNCLSKLEDKWFDEKILREFD